MQAPRPPTYVDPRRVTGDMLRAVPAALERPATWSTQLQVAGGGNQPLLRRSFWLPIKSFDGACQLRLT
jgi:hypothetical protein